MSALREYRYAMGFKVDGQPIPDPAAFSGSDSSLDTSAERDANGMLHRAMVATKHPIKIEWRHIEWHMIGYHVWVDELEPFDAAHGKGFDNGTIFVELAKARAEYAIPSAFAAYTELLKKEG